MAKIRIGIAGYGNLGRGVSQEIEKNGDMELVCIVTRRAVGDIATQAKAPVVHISDAASWQDKVDVMILCGGSATDLPDQGPYFASLFNTVDSYDNHGNIPAYFDKVDAAAKSGGKAALISTGWDPGLFSLNRLLGEVILPKGETYTFWGKGVSQGHSDAVRRVQGVKKAVQYTIPSEEALQRVRNNENPRLATRDKHERVCYVVAEAGADLKRIENEIVNMPNYFADYNTTVHFISEEQFDAQHTAMPHGGHVIRSGETGAEGNINRQLIEFNIALDSNPEFTASVLIAYARAICRFAREGFTGAKTVFDIPFAYLSPKPAAQLRKELL